MSKPAYYTAEMVRALPEDGNRYETDISWDDDVLVQPDLFVVPLSEARTLDWSKMRTLLMAIEVLSPGTARHDRFTKRRLSQEVGIPIYWIVDAKKRFVEVWTPDVKFPQVRDDRVVWDPPHSSESFHVDLADLFRPI